MWRYSRTAMTRFLAPLHLGRERGERIVGHSRSGVPGEQLELALLINAEGIIREASFNTPGSASAIASTSSLIDALLNRHISAAASISEAQLERSLGELPESRLQSPLLGLEALRDAHGQWTEAREEQGDQTDLDLPGAYPLESSERRICFCLKVSEGEIRRAIREGGLATVDAVGQATRAGTGCRSCHPDIAALINDVQPRMAEEASLRERLHEREEAIAAAAGDARVQAVIEMIEDVLDAEVRPKLALDGGGVKIESLTGRELKVVMQGACETCSSVSSTLRYFVEDALREHVDPGMSVIAVKASAGVGSDSCKSA